MNLLDFLIILPILYFCYRGFVNGFVKEVLSIVAIVLGVFLTFRYMDTVSAFIRPLFDESAGYIPFISGAIIFVGTLIVVNAIALGAKRLLESVNLNFINRLFGMTFGFLKSGIIISTLLIILAGFNLPPQRAREDSMTYPYIIYLAPWAYNAVAWIYPGAEDFTSTIRKTLNQYNPVQNFPTLDQ